MWKRTMTLLPLTAALVAGSRATKNDRLTSIPLCHAVAASSAEHEGWHAGRERTPEVRTADALA